MENSIQLWDFQGNQIRTFEKDGEICFIVSDLGKALGLSNVRENISQLDEDEKGVRIVDTLGGPQQMSYVTEPGMYGLVLVSRKDIAKKFKRWLKHEVLPAIRKTGSYSINQEEQLKAQLENMLFFSQVFNALITAVSTHEIKHDTHQIRCVLFLLREIRHMIGEETRDFEGWVKKEHPEAYKPRGRGDVTRMRIVMHDGRPTVQLQFPEEPIK